MNRKFLIVESLLLALSTGLATNDLSAQQQYFDQHCPGRWVQGPSGQNCMCPDGSLANYQGTWPRGRIVCPSAQAPRAARKDWTFSFGQGTFEATVRNVGGSSVVIACVDRFTNKAPSLTLHSWNFQWRARQEAAVNFIIDDTRYSIAIPTGAGGFTLALDDPSPKARSDLEKIVLALANSNEATFAIEFPQHDYRIDVFSLSGANEALVIGGKTIVGDC
ncbi:MAG: hypothetical protein KGZ73_04920 [Rhizobiales bacterium]|nr:hypothetical protein [Hyphomicrobiales bacterium]